MSPGAMMNPGVMNPAAAAVATAAAKRTPAVKSGAQHLQGAMAAGLPPSARKGPGRPPKGQINGMDA